MDLANQINTYQVYSIVGFVAQDLDDHSMKGYIVDNAWYFNLNLYVKIKSLFFSYTII